MGVIVPYDRLQPETLLALIEDFVTREGAVHGHTDTPLPQMVEAVRRQLRSGKAVIVYEEEEESWSIVPKEELKRRGEAGE